MVLFTQPMFTQNMITLRKRFLKSASNKSICQILINDLRKETNKTTVELAYLGALETIWAQYVVNPLTKLRVFNKGKEKINKAVRRAPYNIEIRYLRLSVQQNAPGFLGYNDHITEDDNYLRDNIKKVRSEQLIKMIENLLNN